MLSLLLKGRFRKTFFLQQYWVKYMMKKMVKWVGTHKLDFSIFLSVKFRDHKNGNRGDVPLV